MGMLQKYPAQNWLVKDNSVSWQLCQGEIRFIIQTYCLFFQFVLMCPAPYSYPYIIN